MYGVKHLAGLKFERLFENSRRAICNHLNPDL
jgi:hypothetical protein